MIINRFLTILVGFILLTFFYPQTVGIAASAPAAQVVVLPNQLLEDSLNAILHQNLHAIQLSIESLQQQQTIIQLQTKYNESQLHLLVFPKPVHH